MTRSHNPFWPEFSATDYEPVAERFIGFRAFEVCQTGSLANAGVIPPSGMVVKPTAPADEQPPIGALRGLFKREYVWGSGINEAQCLVPRGPTTVPRVAGKAHHLLMPECECGFWAYTSGSHRIACQGQVVLGIVEGWGRMVIGPSGFRCERARILALCWPQLALDDDDGEVAPEPTVFGGMARALSAVVAAIATALQTVADPPPVMLQTRPISRAVGHEPAPLILRNAVRAAYPELPVFDTVAQMQRAFPLSDLSALLPPPSDVGEPS